MQTIIVLHHFKGTASAIWCPLMIRKHIAIYFFYFIIFDANLCCILMFSLVCPQRHQTRVVGSAAHPQVVLAAEGLQQLLVVSVAHLTQEGQQARHKLPLAAAEGDGDGL